MSDDVAARLATLKRKSAALRGKRPKPVVAKYKPPAVWRGVHLDGCPSWLRPVPPAPKVDGGPPVACSGEESKRRMAKVNSDRETTRRIMTEVPNYRMGGPPGAEGPSARRVDAWDICLVGMAASTRKGGLP